MRGAIGVSPQNFGTTIAEAQYVDQLTNADGTPTHLQVDRSLITFAYSGSSSLILCAVNAGPRPAAALCRTQSAPSGTNTNYSLEITYNGTIAQETIDRLNTFFTILFTVELAVNALANWLRPFLRNAWNFLDAFIVGMYSIALP